MSLTSTAMASFPSYSVVLILTSMGNSAPSLVSTVVSMGSDMSSPLTTLSRSSVARPSRYSGMNSLTGRPSASGP